MIVNNGYMLVFYMSEKIATIVYTKLILIRANNMSPMLSLILTTSERRLIRGFVMNIYTWNRALFRIKN